MPVHATRSPLILDPRDENGGEMLTGFEAFPEAINDIIVLKAGFLRAFCRQEGFIVEPFHSFLGVSHPAELGESRDCAPLFTFFGQAEVFEDLP